MNSTDPTGLDACMAWGGTTCMVGEDGTYYPKGFRPSLPSRFATEAAPSYIMHSGFQPSAGCLADAVCSDSYQTFVSVTTTLGYVPSDYEILMMTAGTEYYDYAGNPNVRVTGQGGLARNYYEACGTDGCGGDDIYHFMSGFQPWFGSVNNMGDGLVDRLVGVLNKDFYGLAGNLRQDVGEILTAKNARWKEGKAANQPWQWFTFQLGSNHNPTFGYGSENNAILSVDLGNSWVFWMFTATQDANFDPAQWK